MPGWGVHAQKKRRDRLIALAATQPDWLVGFEDEVWFSRLAQPGMSAWTFDKDKPLPLCSKERAPDDKAAKALACYGLLLPEQPFGKPEHRQMWLRFVSARPVSAITRQRYPL